MPLLATCQWTRYAPTFVGRCWKVSAMVITCSSIQHGLRTHAAIVGIHPQQHSCNATQLQCFTFSKKPGARLVTKAEAFHKLSAEAFLENNCICMSKDSPRHELSACPWLRRFHGFSGRLSISFQSLHRSWLCACQQIGCPLHTAHIHQACVRLSQAGCQGLCCAPPGPQSHGLEGCAQSHPCQ